MLPATRWFRRPRGFVRYLSSRPSKNDRFSPERRKAREERRQARRSVENVEGIALFRDHIRPHLEAEGHGGVLRKHADIDTLQVNVGLTCNMSCSHCHVESTPTRTETMTMDVCDRILELLAGNEMIKTVDITGGAPEMHECFPRLVKEIRKMGKGVIDRCNLTILREEGYEDVAPFLAEHGVQIVASMPCYEPDNVNKQRGDHTFDRSIEALQLLNKLGYGKQGTGLALDLVYNPLGAFLPPPQKALEQQYKSALQSSFGIVFDSLFCITNMPIKRFADDLRESNQMSEYMHLLANSFSPSNLDSLMCRSSIHVAHNGMISDCDFNYALDVPMLRQGSQHGLSVFEINSFDSLLHHPIHTGNHCYGCTAGAGSS